MTDVHFSWKQLDGIVNPYKSTTGVVTITPLRYSHEDNTLITDASVSKRVDGDYTFKLPPNSPGTFYQFKLAPNEGSTVVEYRFVSDAGSVEYVDLPLVDGEANYIDDPSVPPWVAELEALKKSGDFFVTKIEADLETVSGYSTSAKNHADDARTSAEAAAASESSAKQALDKSADIVQQVKIATDAAVESKASASSASSSAAESRTIHESSTQLHAVMEQTAAQVKTDRDAASDSANAAKTSATNAGASETSSKANADRSEVSATSSSKSAASADSSAKSAASDAVKAASSAMKSEQEAVKATNAATTLNSDAKTFGDAVRSGTFKGDAAPPTKLDVIETKTVSPNTPASVTISGEAPNQNLSFAIPMGLPGSPSEYIKVGAGRPDAPTTTNGIITGSEPIGCEYRSIDGGGIGATSWLKHENKWNVHKMDSGWRNAPIIVKSDSSQVATMTCHVRITERSVFYRLTFVVPSGSSTGWQVSAVNDKWLQDNIFYPGASGLVSRTDTFQFDKTYSWGIRPEGYPNKHIIVGNGLSGLPSGTWVSVGSMPTPSEIPTNLWPRV